MIDNDHVCHYVCDYVDDDVGIRLPLLLSQIVIITHMIAIMVRYIFIISFYSFSIFYQCIYAIIGWNCRGHYPSVLPGGRALLGVGRRFKYTRDRARDGLRWPLLEIGHMGGGHGSARPVITLVLILLSPVLFVCFILFYFYILYRCKLFLFPCSWILLCFHGLIFCSVLVSYDEIKKINQSLYDPAPV